MTQPQPEIGLPPDTPVLTPAGDVMAGALRPGDIVIAVSGTGAPFQPVAELRRGFVPAALVRLRAGALAEGTPRQDLLLPPGHALLLDGLLVEVGALLGGPGVTLEQSAGLREVVHIVLGAQDAILAAGAAVETTRATPADPPLRERSVPDAGLRALLALRAEAMGWAAAPDALEPAPPPGSLAEELAATALAPALPPAPPLPRR